MPKPAPLDIAAIERADRFEVSVFLGTGRYRTEPFLTLAEARAGAERMAREVNNGRRGMIYAVSAGRSVFVPADYQPTTTKEAKETIMDTEFSISQIGQLTAIITGGGYKRANSKDNAIKRFASVAAEKGIDDAIAFLQMPFDEARGSIKARLDVGSKTSLDAAPGKTRKGSPPASTRKLSVTPAAMASKDGAAPKPAGKRAAVLEAAQRGELPEVPDFSANTHKPYRKKLEAVVAMAEAEDIEGLKAFQINPVSSSPKAIAKYRDLALIALEARATRSPAR